MQIPRRKTHNKKAISGKKKFQFLNSGMLGIKTISSGNLIEKNWEVVRKVLNREIKLICGTNRCKTWSSVEFNNTLTKLNLESRMGKGKGSIHSNSKFVREGKILIEFNEIPEHKQNDILFFLQKKLSLKIKFVNI